MDFDTRKPGNGDQPTRSSGASHAGFGASSPSGSIVGAFRGIIFEPTAFYRGVANQDDGPIQPWIFASTCLAIGALGICVSGSTTFALPGDRELSGMRFLNLGPGTADSSVPTLLVLLLLVLLAVFFLVVAGCLLAAFALVSHVLCWYTMAFDERRDIRAAFRAAAYSLPVAALLFWVPVVNFLALGYALYLYAVALSEAHRTSTGRALLVVASVLGVGLLLLLALFGGPALRLMLAVGLLLSFMYSFLPMPVVVGISSFLIIIGFAVYPPMVLAVLVLMIFYLTFLYRA